MQPPHSVELIPYLHQVRFQYEQHDLRNLGSQHGFHKLIFMEVIIRPNADADADLVARIIARELRSNPRLVMGLATGNTMESVYARLVRMHRDEGLNFSSCRTFNLDEYVGLPGNHPSSYRHYMNHHLFLQVNIDLQNTHLLDGTATDLVAK